MEISVELKKLTHLEDTTAKYENISSQEIDANSNEAEIQIEEANHNNGTLKHKLADRKHEKEFYLYTTYNEKEIVVAEYINKMEFKITLLPGLTTQVVIKSKLKRLNNNYWKPVTSRKRREINEFIINLINSGDILLMKKAYNQFLIFDYIIPSPFGQKKMVPDHESILHTCARYGDGDTMLRLLEAKSQHYPLDVRSPKYVKGETILHAAVTERKIDTVNSILKYVPVEKDENRHENQKFRLHRSNTRSQSKEEDTTTIMKGIELINLPNGDNESVIHICVQHQYYDLLQIFLNEGADLTIQNKYGYNVLHEAIIQNDMTALNMIIQHQKDKGEVGEAELKNLLKAKDVKEASPTEHAEDRRIIETILNCYEDKKEKSEQLGILLSSATDRNKIDIATFLVSKGASLDCENKKGMTPLKLASLRGYKELADYMLMEGGDPNQHRGTKSNVAINNAAKSGHLDLIKILLKHNASLWDDSIMEKSALHSAVYGGHSNLIRFLVDTQKMNPNTRDINGKTPLYYAIEGSHRDCVKELLSCKADPELPVDEEGQIAVHLAARHKDRSILKLLLDYGARSEEKDDHGKAAIDIALEMDYPQILKLLLEHNVSLDRDNKELNTPMHVIAICGSYKCADYLLRKAKVKDAFEQLNVRNVDKETPIDIAKRKGHNSVLITYIEKTKCDYFDNNPSIYHEFFEAGQFDILKKIFDRMCEKNNAGTEVYCTAIMLDTNGKGQSPFSKNFSHLLPSLLHKLIECEDKELREHPIVKKTVEKKLNFYRIWYTITLLLFLAFVIVLSTAFYLASHECDSDLRGFEFVTAGSSIRTLLETIVCAYVILLTFSELVEFAYGWSKIIKSRFYERKMKRNNLYISNETEGEKTEENTNPPNNKNYFLMILELGSTLLRLIFFLDVCLFYFPSATLHYLYDSPLDVLGIVSIFLYFFIRLSNPSIAWIFASLAYIAFIISLLKYTRIIPSLGAYIETVKAVFSKDIPRFLVLYLIVVVAFIGGSHLAARFHLDQTLQNTELQHLGTVENICINDTTRMLYFNEDTTSEYTILIPLVTGLILLLDGGPGNREDDILHINLYFAVIYLLFSFTIIVVLSNILIAQLSETYAALSAQGTFYYRMGLIVTMELESSIAFFLGKYFRQLASIRTFKVPIDEWKTLLNSTPDQNIGSHLEILEDKINRNTVVLNEGGEKSLLLMEYVVALDEKLDGIDKHLEGFTPTVDAAGKQPIPEEIFTKGKIEERLGMLESSIQHVGFQIAGLDNKLNQTLDLMKKLT